jgi:DNA-binding NarL/FixJ family response regulator
MSITISSQDQMHTSDAYALSLSLAPIEHRILNLQKSGKTVKDIGDTLGLSPTDVYRRLDIISKKIKSQRLLQTS